MSEKPNPYDFEKIEFPGEFDIGLHVSGKHMTTIKASDITEAKRIAEEMAEKAVDDGALRRFLISHMEEQAAKFDREANRLRFEAISWSEQQADKMRAEIAAFNAEHLK